MKRTVGILTLCFLLAIYSCHVMAAPPQKGSVYCRNTSHVKQIALSFDDGPHPRYTKEILSILKEYGISATFFVIGINAELYPETLKMVADAGCEIGNHTYSHDRLANRSEEQIRQEIEKCQRVVQELVGIRPVLFRPPQGATSESVKVVSRKMDYDIILWSIDTRDWEHTPKEQIVETVRSQVKGGDIILMHDYVSGSNATCESLRILIPELLSKGYEFVTVSQLIN